MKDIKHDPSNKLFILDITANHIFENYTMQIRSTFYNFLLINPEKSFSVQFRFGYCGNLKELVVNEIFKTAHD